MRTRAEFPTGHARGAAMVEMAIVVTVFLMIILGIVEFGNYLMVNQAVVSAARDGARRAAVLPTLAANDGRVAAVALERLRPVGSCQGSTVTNNKPSKVGDSVSVEVSCQYQWLTKVTWFQMLQNFRIDEKATMYWEG